MFCNDSLRRIFVGKENREITDERKNVRINPLIQHGSKRGQTAYGDKKDECSGKADFHEQEFRQRPDGNLYLQFLPRRYDPLQNNQSVRISKNGSWKELREPSKRLKFERPMLPRRKTSMKCIGHGETKNNPPTSHWNLWKAGRNILWKGTRIWKFHLKNKGKNLERCTFTNSFKHKYIWTLYH